MVSNQSRNLVGLTPVEYPSHARAKLKKVSGDARALFANWNSQMSARSRRLTDNDPSGQKVPKHDNFTTTSDQLKLVRQMRHAADEESRTDNLRFDLEKNSTLSKMPKNLKKNVTFAPPASMKVYLIAQGQGTWENGQARANYPTPFEISNMSRLAAQTLAHIEHLEKAGTNVERKPTVQGTPYIHAQNGAQTTGEPAQSSGSATFDTFLPQEKLLDEHTHRRPTAKSFSSLVSLKSLSKTLKQKILGNKIKS
ncbi:hypothetical protein SLS60_004257 [Paraconiothyrium brasiliense]|uniref:Uncharacterized protein n=1 Tax=Paraconiothyrium brasiliense TaxID=300254 RepID=A0ABR3RQX5_9PLEO